MRRAAKVDDNQADVVKRFRAHGFSVEPLHAVGGGVPDLLIGYGGFNYLIEVKDGAKPPSQRKLTKDQIKWHGAWAGQVAIIETLEQVDEFCKKILDLAIRAG